jgi:hypothetical protein
MEVINIKNYNNEDYIYIGRPSKYGNPYSSKKSKIAQNVNSKEESLKLFEQYLNDNDFLVDDLIEEMKEKGVNKLGCFCKPSKCHGDIYIKKIKEKSYKSIL